MLRAVLNLLGKGMVESFEFRMKDYLEQTNGPLHMKARVSWELEAASSILRRNNATEQPFAVLRQYKRGRFIPLCLSRTCQSLYIPSSMEPTVPVPMVWQLALL
jgi:hypothetical protein